MSTIKAACAITHAAFEAGFRVWAEHSGDSLSARDVLDVHPSWSADMVTVFLNGAEDGARGDRFRLDLACGLCGMDQR